MNELTLISVYKSKIRRYISLREIYERYKKHLNTFVYTKNGIKKVSKVIDGGIQDTFKITLSNRESICCTLDQKFIKYVNEEPVSVSYLEIGDELLEVKESNILNIVSISPVGMRRVFNLQVEEADNFALKAGVYSSI